MRLLLSSYTKWLTIAFLIALPIALLLGKASWEGFISILQCHSGHL
jgi:hypothetical protein